LPPRGGAATTDRVRVAADVVRVDTMRSCHGGAELGTDQRPADHRQPFRYTPPMPVASWLFVKDGQSIWIERPYGLSMIVAGPGAAREQHEFADEEALETFQIALGERLSEAGWLLWGFDRERRSGRDRRLSRRKSPERRREPPGSMRR
jgi:hypothetical protein